MRFHPLKIRVFLHFSECNLDISQPPRADFIKNIDFIKIADGILNKGAIEYVKKNINKILAGYESGRQKYYQQRPEGAKELKEIQDAVIINLIYRLKE